MKFVATEEIAAPVEDVWAAVTDFDAFEARASQRVSLERRPPGPASLGTVWDGQAEVMGTSRDVEMRLSELKAPHVIAMTGKSDGLNLLANAQLEVLGPRRTRLTVTTAAEGNSLGARLVLQPLKLAKKTLLQRYRGYVANFARRIEKGSRRA
ncbi:SRPBCC family protein [uncultured Jannaschia sp.]|uniref:SRPBCC family protein n=1 Tax=uncultured Jannaschia sp. TaxID=293347 RepID=UPI00263324E5|nr:SRPBCC family protein [uncultured Jannaschia sp.]